MKATNEFHRYKSTKTVYAISPMPHVSENAFKEYHQHTPYLQELCDVIGGPTRVAKFLAKTHQDVYVSVGMANNLGVGNICRLVSPQKKNLRTAVRIASLNPTTLLDNDDSRPPMDVEADATYH